VRLAVIRDGREMNLTATLAERDVASAGDQEDDGKTSSEDSRERIGISVTELTPQVRQMQNIPTNITGLLVVHLKEVSPAAETPIREGDVITEVNGRRITSTDEFGKIVSGARKGDYLRMYVVRPPGRSGNSISFFALVKID
jgi:serine protease Do